MESMEEPLVMTRRASNRQDDDIPYVDRNLLLASEALRTSQSATDLRKPEEKLSVFWRVFGGTILSITALVLIQAYQGVAGNINELRSEISRLREISADFVKKDDLGARTSNLWNRVQDLQGLNATVTVTGNKITGLEQQLLISETERKDLVREVQALRERLAKLEGTKSSKE